MKLHRPQTADPSTFRRGLRNGMSTDTHSVSTRGFLTNPRRHYGKSKNNERTFSKFLGKRKWLKSKNTDNVYPNSKYINTGKGGLNIFDERKSKSLNQSFRSNGSRKEKRRKLTKISTKINKLPSSVTSSSRSSSQRKGKALKSNKTKNKKIELLKEHVWFREVQTFEPISKILRNIMDKQTVKINFLSKGISVKEYRDLTRGIEDEISIVKRKVQNSNPKVLSKYVKSRVREIILERKQRFGQIFKLLDTIDKELTDYERTSIRGTFEETLEESEVNNLLMKFGEISRDKVLDLSKKKVSSMLEKQKQNLFKRNQLFRHFEKTSENFSSIGSSNLGFEHSKNLDSPRTQKDEINGQTKNSGYDEDDDDDELFNSLIEDGMNRSKSRKEIMNNIGIMKTHVAISILNLKSIFGRCKEFQTEESKKSILKMKKITQLEIELNKQRKLVARQNQRSIFLKSKLQQKETKIHQIRLENSKLSQILRTIISRVKESDEKSFDKRWILEYENMRSSNIFSASPDGKKDSRIIGNEQEEQEDKENSNSVSEQEICCVSEEVNGDSEQAILKNEEALSLFDPRFKSSEELIRDLVLIRNPSQMKIILTKFFLEREKIVYFLSSLHKKSILLFEHLKKIIELKIYKYDDSFIDAWNSISREINNDIFGFEKRTRLLGKEKSLAKNENLEEMLDGYDFEVEDIYEEVFGCKLSKNEENPRRNLISQQIHDILNSEDFEKKKDDPIAINKSLTGILVSLFYKFRKILVSMKMSGKDSMIQVESIGGWKFQQSEKLSKLKGILSEKVVKNKKILYSSNKKERAYLAGMKLKKAFQKSFSLRSKKTAEENLKKSEEIGKQEMNMEEVKESFLPIPKEKKKLNMEKFESTENLFEKKNGDLPKTRILEEEELGNTNKTNGIFLEVPVSKDNSEAGEVSTIHRDRKILGTPEKKRREKIIRDLS